MAKERQRNRKGGDREKGDRQTFSVLILHELKLFLPLTGTRIGKNKGRITLQQIPQEALKNRVS